MRPHTLRLGYLALHCPVTTAELVDIGRIMGGLRVICISGVQGKSGNSGRIFPVLAGRKVSAIILEGLKGTKELKG